MNTIHISAILNSLPDCSDIFKGVYPRDIFLRQEITYPSVFVCNTDNSSQPGTHWVAVYFSEKRKCEYFDSYGIPPINDDMHIKLSAIDSNYKRNCHVLQSWDTNVCGIYCIVYALMKCKGCSLRVITNLFLHTESCHERDHVLKQFIETNFSQLLEICGDLPTIHINGRSLPSQSCIFRTDTPLQ